jgi:anti-sigma B factor antagonist
MHDSLDHDHPPANALRVTVDGDIAKMAIAGEVDLLRAPAIATALRDLLGTHRIRGVMLDLQQVSFMDSTGIQVLVAAHRDATANGLTVAITAASTPVRRLLMLTGTDETFGLTG